MRQLDQKSVVSRRDFLQMIAALGGLAISAFLQACSRTSSVTPTPSLTAETPTRTATSTLEPTSTMTATATSTPEPTLAATATSAPTLEPTPAITLTSAPVVIVQEEMVPVAFVKTTDRAEGVRAALDLLGINPVAGKTVFIKPNFNSADPAPGSTHPDVLRALVQRLQEMGAGAITVGDRSGMGLTRDVMNTLGVHEMAEELGFEVISLAHLFESTDWIKFVPRDSHWQQGFYVARPCLDAAAIVSVCCLKTHQYGGHFTMSLKNSVGLVAMDVPDIAHNFMDELHTSSHMRAMIAEINTAYTPALIVVDGVEAFTAGGPDTGRLASSEVLLAGTDRIAIDAVGVALLRYFHTTSQVSRGPIFQQEQIARAVELGLGVDSPHKIKLVTGDAASAAYAEEIREVLVET